MSKKIAIVAMVVLLAAMGGVVAYYLMNKGADNAAMQTDAAPAVSGEAPAMEEAQEGPLALKDESMAGEAPAAPEAAEGAAETTEQAASEQAAGAQAPPEQEQAAGSGLPQPEPVVGGAAAGKFALQPPDGKAVAAKAPSSGTIAPGTDKAPPAPPAPPKPKIETKPAPKPVAATAAKKGNRLDKVEVLKAGEAVTVRLHAAGPVGAFKHFPLKSPSRLVVDLLGTWQASKNPAVPDNGMVKSIRIGRHADKLRLVLDLTAAVKVGGTVEKESDNQLVVTVR